MNTSPVLSLADLVAVLRADRKAWPDVAKATGVSEHTLRKLACGDRKNPTVKIVQPLYDYFNREQAGGVTTLPLQRCTVCGDDRIAKRRSLCYSCRRANPPEKTCCDCNARFRALGNGQRCKACAHGRSLFSQFASGRAFAGLAVAAARRRGSLPPPSDSPCADCGGRATDYDHRDYNEPLRVESVCRGCNLRRKAAIPRSWSFDEFCAWFFRPLTGHAHRRIASRWSRDDLELARRHMPAEQREAA